ncbi:hypothetical protein AB0O34_09820 [Sphaerisporangium sp. NPDC088356]|uniref:hypothetical protein n=1 Tax=Sphaerisporangium sp. NPDC088356 TaxID=3154871 RepID=UPI00344AD0FD
MIPREKGSFIGKPAWTLAVATAITGGFVALSCPAMAHAGTEARSVPGHQVSYDANHAPAGAVTSQRKPVGDDDDEDGKSKCSKKCNPGPLGPPGPRGRGDGIDSALATPTGALGPVKYIGLAQGNGTVFVRDPTSVAANPVWHDLTTLSGFPGNVTDISLTAVPTTNALHITLRSLTGHVVQTTCLVTVNATWPGICGAFVNFTPPL